MTKITISFDLDEIGGRGIFTEIIGNTTSFLGVWIVFIAIESIFETG
ncbi:hypothetical protein [Methylovulum sp.]|nr:hypothetical protein [Methylovulum sp.]MDD5126382.1 hypothetical protein [Methylovulum sp.]